MKSIYGITRKKMQSFLQTLDFKPFRSTQIFEWVYRRGISNFAEMTNISKEAIKDLEENFEFSSLEIETLQISEDGTRKYLFKLDSKHFIETVLMRHNYGYSLCISTQVGCNMGCSFCASGLNKRQRNLSVEEMVLQVLTVNNHLKDEGNRVTHVVIMGIGEPFDNYDNVMDFINIINDPKGLEIGARHITISTCGIVPKIYDFANLDLQVNLAVSLHFANDELRTEHMPINKAHNLEQLMEVLKYYYDKTNRRITFEYILLDGINDTYEAAMELVRLIRGMNCYVNLIPMNATDGLLRRSSKQATDQFYNVLVKQGINVTVRREFGHDIDAACGQLRIKRERK
jgi:23S rRNA (adenine2503-C2)-methyltransferase